MTRAVSIRLLLREHWPQVEAIYAAGIATGHATFEAEPPSWTVFDSRTLPGQRLVAVDPTDRVLGWAAASAAATAAVPMRTVEDVVYVDPVEQRRGVGRFLLDALAASTEGAGITTIQAGILPENRPGLRLHLEAGFSLVGTRPRAGQMPSGPLAGQWRELLTVERRSTVARIY